MSKDPKKIKIELIRNGDAADNTIYYLRRNGLVLKNSFTTSESGAKIIFDREVTFARGGEFKTTVIESTEI